MPGQDVFADNPRLQQAVLEWLQSVDRGEPLDRSELLRRFPDVGRELAGWFLLSDTLEQTGEFSLNDASGRLKRDASTASIPHDIHDTITKLTAAAGRLPTTSGVPDLAPEFDQVELLRRGGMGVVYRARQCALNRPVALKFVLMGDLANEEEQKRFQVEAEALAQLHHPGIVAVYGTGECNGQPYLVMELIEGTNLKELTQDQPLPARRAAGIVQSVAAAVEQAHQQGILHRDLKPSNILIDSQGDPHVTDFGLARLAGDRTELTVTGQVLGTPGYMSPEQTAGAEKMDHRSDVYSLGTVLYTILAGRPPFRSESAAQTLQLVLTQTPPDLCNLAPGVPEDLETICQKCLRKSPGSRYQSAQALADDLERFLNHQPIQARRTPGPERLRLWCLRNPATAVAAVLSLVLMAVVLIGAGIHYSDIQQLNQGLELRNQELDQSLTVVRELRDQEQQLRHNAQTALLRARQLQYASDVERAMQAWQRHDTRLMRTLLDAQLPPPGQPDVRGFAWYYLNSQLPVALWTNSEMSSACYALAVSPDEQFCATAGEDGRIQVVRLSDGTRQHVWDSGQKEVNRLAFDPTGTQLASAGDDGTVCRWSLADGTLLECLVISPGEEVYFTEYSADGQTLYAAGQSQYIRRRNLTNNTWLPDWEAADSSAGVTSLLLQFPEQDQLISLGAGRKGLLWNIGSGTAEELSLPSRSERLTAAACSPDGQSLVVGYVSGRFDVVPMNTEPGDSLLLTRPDGIQTIGFSADGTMAVGDRGGAVSLWGPPANGKIDTVPRRAWHVSRQRIAEIRFLHEGRQLLTTDYAGAVSLWSTEDIRTRITIPADRSGFDPRSTILTACPDGTFVLSEARRLMRFHPARQNEDWLEHVVEAGEFTALATEDGNALKAHDPLQLDNHLAGVAGRVEFGTPADDQQSESRAVEIIGDRIYLPDSQVLLAQVQPNCAYEIHVPSGRCRLISNHCHSLALQSDGRVLWLSEGRSNDLVAIDRTTLQEQTRIRAHTAGVNRIRLSADDRFLASTGNDRRLAVWNTDTGNLLWSVESLPHEPLGLAWSPDGLTLAVGASDGSVRLYQAQTGREVLQLTPGHPTPQWTVPLFSRDGEWLAVVRDGRVLEAFRAASPAP